MADRLDSKWPPKLLELLIYVFSKTLHDQETIVTLSMCVPALRDVLGDGQVGKIVCRHPAVNFRHREVGKGVSRNDAL